MFDSSFFNYLTIVIIYLFIVSCFFFIIIICDEKKTRKREDKFHWAIELVTRSLPCFSELYSNFYVNGKKVIPDNIYDLLTARALAHLIMGDGSVERSSLIICTDSYTLKDVVRMINVLIIKYRLECSLRFHRPNQPRIYIKEKSMPLIRDIVKSHMCSSMLYKIKL